MLIRFLLAHHGDHGVDHQPQLERVETSLEHSLAHLVRTDDGAPARRVADITYTRHRLGLSFSFDDFLTRFQSERRS